MTRDVLNHLRDLDENLKDWETYIDEISESAFLKDRGSRHKLLHAVLVAVQAAIDIGNHWVSQLTPQRPDTYRAIVEVLEENHAIASRLAKDLKGLFGLRNVLIHKYQELDLKKLYQHLRKGSKPLRIFLQQAKSKAKL